LSGQTKIDDFTIKPSAKLFYMQENWDGYSVTNGIRNVDVSGGEAKIGTLSSKLEISNLQKYETFNFEPSASAEITWTFTDPGIYNTNGKLEQTTPLSATLSAGVQISNQTTAIRLEGTYGGLGSGGLENFGGKLSIAHRF